MAKMKELSILLEESEYALAVIERHLGSGNYITAFAAGVKALDLLEDITKLHKRHDAPF